MSRLEKAVYIMYIFIAMIVGGTAAYFMVTEDEKNFQNISRIILGNNAEKKSGQVVNVDSNLCIRDGPSLDSEVFYMLYEGMTFDILEKDGNWYKIKYNDITGYVNKDYVEEYDGDTPPNKTYEEREKDIIPDIDGEAVEPIKAELTAYCNCKICSDNWGSETAMQTQTRVGVVAAPKEITLGSRLYIPELKDYKEDGIFDVEDRGGAVEVKDDGTYIIDVWLSNHDDVKEFGRKKTTVYLIKN